LIREDSLVGVCTFGTPPSAPLRRGVAGDTYASSVLELNRLCLADNLPNEASFLISRSIKLLPSKRIIVSFADPSYGHNGCVYRAANFLYCGLSAKRTDWKLRGKEHLHGQTIADEFRGSSNRSEKMKAKYGDAFYLAPRQQKHRYIYIHGPKKWKKQALKALRYRIYNEEERREVLRRQIRGM
jgi:hypothetical protein